VPWTSHDPPLTDEQRRLAANYWRMAKRLACQWTARWPALADELESAAALGLVHAVRRFDPSRGVKLATYICYAVKGEMRHALRRALRRWAGERPLPGRPGSMSSNRLPDADLEELEEVERLLCLLPRQDDAFLRIIAFEGRTPTDAARKLGFSKSWASDHRKQALAELRAVAEGRC
jgi:RNA polymerase sigma factor (sigma-70 family)